MNLPRIVLFFGLGVAFTFALRGGLLAPGISATWIAQLHGIARLENGAVAVLIPSAESVRGIAVDHPRRRVWVHAGSRLLSYDFDGVQRSAAALDSQGDSPVVGIAMDTQHAQLWVGRGNVLEVHAVTGERLATLNLPGVRQIQALGYDRRRDEVWVAADDRVRWFAPNGEPSSEPPTDRRRRAAALTASRTVTP